ncbi:MAG: glycosyltransferase [Solirubrobacterales bacterium]
MRVLQVHTRYRQAGGEDGVADAEVALLREAGHEVVAIRRRNSDSAAEAAKQLATYPWNPASNHRLLELARKIRPQVVHFHNTWFATSPAALKALRRQGFPTVVTIHNYRLSCVNAELLRDGKPCELCVGTTPWRGVLHRCYHESAGRSAAAAVGIQAHRTMGTWRKGVDRFVALTEFSRDKLVAGGLPRDRIVVRPNFVADPGPRKAGPSTSRKIVFAGRISPEKGLRVALAAWARAQPRNLELLIAGDGPQRAELEAMRVSGVRFLGRLPRAELDALLLTSRATISPSIWFESQPLTVLESFAAGTPVLAAKIGGLGETVKPVDPGWLVRSGDVEAWATALGRLGDDLFIDRGGEECRQTFERHHSKGRAKATLERTYAEATSEHQPGVAP